MKIVVLTEGKTEIALRSKLHDFINDRLPIGVERRIGIQTKPLKGKMNCEEIKDRVTMSLEKEDVMAVIVLCDVYPNFNSAEETKKFLRDCVGNQPRFHAHAAQFDFEAWLMPYWDDICRKLRISRQPPGTNPEEINDRMPPSKHLMKLYRDANRRYDKVRDAHAILRNKDLTVAAGKCRELRSFLNTLLTCAGLAPLL
jgi:hypothetical protein